MADSKPSPTSNIIIIAVPTLQRWHQSWSATTKNLLYKTFRIFNLGVIHSAKGRRRVWPSSMQIPCLFSKLINQSNFFINTSWIIPYPMSSSETDSARDKLCHNIMPINVNWCHLYSLNTKSKERKSTINRSIYIIASRPFSHIPSCKLNKQFNITQLRLRDS